YPDGSLAARFALSIMRCRSGWTGYGPTERRCHPPHSKAQRARPVLHQEELSALADAVDADSHWRRPQLRWTRVQWFSRMRSAAFSPTITAGGGALPWGVTGKTEGGGPPNTSPR